MMMMMVIMSVIRLIFFFILIEKVLICRFSPRSNRSIAVPYAVISVDFVITIVIIN